MPYDRKKNNRTENIFTNLNTLNKTSLPSEHNKAKSSARQAMILFQRPEMGIIKEDGPAGDRDLQNYREKIIGTTYQKSTSQNLKDLTAKKKISALNMRKILAKSKRSRMLVIDKLKQARKKMEGLNETLRKTNEMGYKMGKRAVWSTRPSGFASPEKREAWSVKKKNMKNLRIKREKDRKRREARHNTLSTGWKPSMMNKNPNWWGGEGKPYEDFRIKEDPVLNKYRPSPSKSLPIIKKSYKYSPLTPLPPK